MKYKFKCSSCGNCCKNLAIKPKLDQIGQDEKETFEKNQNRQSNEEPIVRIAPLDSSGLPIEEWEVETLKKISQERGIKINIIPLYVIFDLNQNISLIYRWLLEGKDCPFLKENRCLIYDDRPLRCRSYPLATQFENGSVRLSYLLCPENKNPEGVFSTDQILNIYGNIFRYTLNSLQVKEYKEKMITTLINKEIIFPALNYSFEDLLEKITNHPKIGMFEFMINQRIIALEKHRQTIETLEKHKIV